MDQLPAGTNLKFIESEEDMAVDVPQETDVADRGRRADGEPQLEDAMKLYLMKNRNYLKIGFRARWKMFLTDLGILEGNIDHLIIMERYLTEGGSSV